MFLPNENRRPRKAPLPGHSRAGPDAGAQSGPAPVMPRILRIARYSAAMDKSGLLFVILLGALIALVVSILLIENEPATQPDDGSLIPPPAVDQTP